MRTNPLCLASIFSSLLVGCGFGLDQEVGVAIPAPSFTEENAEVAEADDGLPETAVDLEGRLYVMEAADMHVAQPPGLDGLWSKVLSRPLLVYVAGESSTALQLSAAIGTAEGEQDPCERVRTFPEADWSENPVFDAGPGVLDTSFAGTPATLEKVRLSGVVDEFGFGWRDGTLDAVVDTRDLRAALGGMDDVCGLVSELGGSCFACADGEEACFTLAIDGVSARYSESPFDTSPDRSGCR
jgi:hypothetical protein